MRKPILSLSFGPIGDTLMLLTFFSELHEQDNSLRFAILAERGGRTIADLAQALPYVEVWDVSGSVLRRIVFVVRVLARSWTIFIPGVAQLYSWHLRFFFFLLSSRPGNRTVALEGINSRKQRVPVHLLLPYHPELTVIENFRLATPSVLPGMVLEAGVPPQLPLATRTPPDFPFRTGDYVVVHMFGMSKKRSLPPARWHRFLEELARRYSKLSFVITGTARDATVAHEISANIPRVFFAIDLPILEVAGIIANAACYIGVDTGITHLAGVLQKKSVIIGNLSNPTWLPTYNPNAHVLTNAEHCTCNGDKTGDCYVWEDGQPYYRCMYEMSDEVLYASVDQVLMGSGAV
jgi:ADP-heptose:LPS heptosyltransferase